MIRVTYKETSPYSDGSSRILTGTRCRIEYETERWYSEETGGDPSSLQIIMDESKHNRAYLSGDCLVIIEQVERTEGLEPERRGAR